MELVHSDAVFRVPPETSPDYDHDNPILRLATLVEEVELAVEREHYDPTSLQYLYPFDVLELYGPSSPLQDLTDAAQQDVKTDFQKQNLRSFRGADTRIVRGWVVTEEGDTPFVRLSYRAGPDSQLARSIGRPLGDRIKVWAGIGNRSAPAPFFVPYVERSHRYEVELWGESLPSAVDGKGQAALATGELQIRPDLVAGRRSDFEREAVGDRAIYTVAPDRTLHPILPLHIQIAWADEQEKTWDSRNGANHHYEFSMLVRGWEHYIGVGDSANPHGGVGGLEYRNLLSNYGRYRERLELGREVPPWSFDAFGNKAGVPRSEPFMAVDYMDLHALHSTSGIGLHRHRDNQEAFLMLRGQGLMVVGDWAQMPGRERAFEVRTLRAGHLAMLRGGQLHGLLNPSDEELLLFMFGGYD